MASLSAAQHSQIYTELTEATSEATAEVIMQGLLEAPWDNLVTNDRLDARFAEIDARFAEVDARFVRLESRMDARFAEVGTRFAEADAKLEKSLRSLAFRMLTAMFAMNGAFVAVMVALR